LVAWVVRGFPGRTVEVPVALRYRTNDPQDVVAFQADLVFDATGLHDGMPASGGQLVSHVLASANPANGTRRLLVYSAGNAVLTNGEVARIPFTVGLNEYRNFSLRLTNLIMVRADALPVTGSSANGVIVVNQVFLGSDGHADGFLNVTSSGAEQCYLIQATTDFVTWVNVQTNSTEGGLLEFADPQAGLFSSRFYRAVVCEGSDGLRIGTITQLPNGGVEFQFNGSHGRSYIIQGSTNLTHWENIRTNVGANGPSTFTESFTQFARRFYRVKRAE